MKKIILLLFGIFLLLTGPQEASAFLYFRPPKSPIPPKPIIIIPTRIPIKWTIKPIKPPTVTPSTTPSSTPTSTPSPTATPTPKIIESQGMLKFQTSPISKISVGDTLDIKLLVNTTGEQIINIDGIIVYDPNKVTINSVQTGHFLTYFSASPLGGSTNKYLASSWEESISHAKSSTTDTLWASINVTFKEKGETTLSFDCTQGTEADSNINRASDSTDILNCSSLVPLTLQIEN